MFITIIMTKIKGSYIKDAFKRKETFIGNLFGNASDAATDAANSDEAKDIAGQASEDISSNESLAGTKKVRSFSDAFEFVIQLMLSSSIGIAITVLFLYMDKKFTGPQPNVLHIRNVLMTVGGVSLALFLFGGTILQVIIPMIGKKGKEGAKKINDEISKDEALKQAIQNASTATSTSTDTVNTATNADVQSTADSVISAASKASADVQSK